MSKEENDNEIHKLSGILSLTSTYIYMLSARNSHLKTSIHNGSSHTLEDRSYISHFPFKTEINQTGDG